MLITCISGHFMHSNIGLKKLHIEMRMDIQFFDYPNFSPHKKIEFEAYFRFPTHK